MDQKQAIADKLKEANNILVTVSTNPSVDQLASCIGMALALNKLGKHATAVFSGVAPSTIEFLQPEKTLEKTTDSLRDFIISLDKAKADKLRYKVEDKVVKIFITPYRTSISDKDLEFSQGDFNVDLVIALGVHRQADLDQAITAHGRILHDAAVATLNIKPGGDLGTMNWLEPRASSLCELAVELLDIVDKQVLDAQMATAFLTGIVAETKRFSNERTSPMTMSISAELMNAGANQQLVATKLEEPKPVPVQQPAPVAAAPVPVAAPVAAAPPVTHNEPPASVQPVALKNKAVPKPEDGTLEIAHDKLVLDPDAPVDLEEKEEVAAPMPQINIDEQGSLVNVRDIPEDKGLTGPASMLPKPNDTTDPMHHMENQHMILQPPSMGGQLTANTLPDYMQPDHDPLSTQPTNDMPLLSRNPSPPPAAPTAVPANSSYDPLTAPAGGPGGFAPAAGPSLPPLGGAPSFSSAPVSMPGAPSVAPSTPQMTPLPTDTLSQIEAGVHSPHLQQADPAAASLGTPPAAVDDARDAVNQAMAGQPYQPGAIQALNAQPLGSALHAPTVISPTSTPPPVPPPMMPPTQ